MENHPIGNRIVWFDEISSTNDYATKLAFEAESHGVVVATAFQTKGRGQRGAYWESERGENLLFSVVLHPHFLEVRRQFLLSKAIAMAVCDVLGEMMPGVCVKWPNDIYVENKKVAGILIEHSFSTAFLDTTIVGVGLNVNQRIFRSHAPNPTSLRLIVGELIDLEPLLKTICRAFEMRYAQVRNEPKKLSEAYLNRLFRLGTFCDYREGDRIFSAKIIGVADSGELIVQTPDLRTAEYAFKEIEYVL